MKTIKIWNDSPSERQLGELARDLQAGALAVIPTDTAYAIVCDALNVKAIDRLCRLKGINPDKTNLAIICSDISMAAQYAKIDNDNYRLLKANTPGPFTFLFRALHSLPKAFKGRKTVGIRIPDCNLDTQLAGAMNSPLLTTTIEYSDEDHARSPELIAETYWNSVDIMVEGEEGTSDLSTVVDCTGETPEILRQSKGELNA